MCTTFGSVASNFPILSLWVSVLIDYKPNYLNKYGKLIMIQILENRLVIYLILAELCGILHHSAPVQNRCGAKYR